MDGPTPVPEFGEEVVNGTVQRALAVLTLATGAAVVAPTIASAQDASPIVEYRQSIMQAFRTHMGGVRAALGDVAPMGHAEHHAVAFEHMAQALANAFPENTAGPGSRALPAIWENRDDFMNKVTAIQTATAQLVEAAGSGDAEVMSQALQGVQGTCAGCHQTYRGPAN